jgi:16S rRNA (guanine966-N2)-methyltransferase
VLDLFAGSGALGIEALSRGAQSAEFVEQGREAARVIDANLRATGLDERAHVTCAPVALALARLDGPIDLAFADPPYQDATALAQTVELLGRPGLLRPTGVVVLEQPATAEPPPRVGSLPLNKTRRHGRTRVSLYAADAADAAEADPPAAPGPGGATC